MPVLKLPAFQCLRCEHTWIPRPSPYRKDGTKPVRCPKCGSAYWDKPKRKQR